MLPQDARFEFGSRLGRGGHGEVYLAVMVGQAGFRRQVAVKLVNQAEVDAGRLRDEGRLLGLLDHVHIVRALGIEQIGERWAVVMEYIEGVDLQQILPRGPLPEPVTRALIRGVALALEAAHTAIDPATKLPLRIVHRDVKPANVRVTPEGLVKLVDFGIARSELEGREALTVGVRFETEGYTAPERYGGEEAPPADVFSLGVVLYECLRGLPLGPVPAHADLFGPAIERAVAELNASDDLTALLREMLAYRPEDRPEARVVAERLETGASSATELKGWANEVVRPLVDAQSFETRVDATATIAVDAAPTRPAARIRRPLIASAWVVAGAVASAAAWALWIAPGTEPPAEISDGPCTILPSNNPWNTDISAATVHPDSQGFVLAMDPKATLNIGSNGSVFEVERVSSRHIRAELDFVKWKDESDLGIYPIPIAAVEDHTYYREHRTSILLDREACLLFEVVGLRPFFDGEAWDYQASNAAIFNLRSNALRPDEWTSADAAGLPIYPGLLRQSEVQDGAIPHALRVTSTTSQRGFIHPATHAGDRFQPKDGRIPPPRGLRLRMKATYDCTPLRTDVQIVCRALKTYGVLLSSNGTKWGLSTLEEDVWDPDFQAELRSIPGSAFEAVYTGEIIRQK